MATLAIFTFIGAWNDFLWPLIVTNSDAMRTLPVGLALLARRNTVVWGPTMAGTVLTVVPHGHRLPAPAAALHRRADGGSREGRRLTS